MYCFRIGKSKLKVKDKMHLPYECDFCIFNFATRSDRDTHLMQHFKRECCNICDKTIARIGDNWYELRLHYDGNCCPKERNQTSDHVEKAAKIEETPLEEWMYPIQEMCKLSNETDNAVPKTNDIFLEDRRIEIEFKSEEILETPDTLTAEISDTRAFTPEDRGLEFEHGNGNGNETILNEEIIKLDPDEIKKRLNRRNRCDICNKEFKHACSLLRHLKQGHPVKIKVKAEPIRVPVKKERPVKKKRLVEKGRHLITCEACPEVFTNKRDLETHIKQLHDGKRFKCQTCGARYACRKWFNVHKAKHSANKQVTCDICRKQFHHKFYLRKHMDIHINPDKYNRIYNVTCDICKKCFRHLSSLRSHMDIHIDPQKNRCEICEKQMSSEKRYHEHKCPMNRTETTQQCRFCNAIYPDKQSLRRHMNTHAEFRRFVCTTCGKSFTSEYFLNNHMNIHTREKTYACDFCDKKYYHAANLAQHKRIHTGEKPFKCPIDGCESFFGQSGDRTRHLFVIHRIYTKKHICPICSRVFPTSTNLKRHIRVHANNAVD